MATATGRILTPQVQFDSQSGPSLQAQYAPEVVVALTHNLSFAQVQSLGGVYVVSFFLGTTTGSSVSLLPVSVFVYNMFVLITTPYTGGTTISVGQTGATSAFMPVGSNDPTTIGAYPVRQWTQSNSSPRAVLATVAGGPVAGAAQIVVSYTIPLP